MTTNITQLPTAPSRADPTNFRTRADAFLAALVTLSTEINAWALTNPQPAFAMGGAISNPSNYAANFGSGALTAGKITSTANGELFSKSAVTTNAQYMAIESTGAGDMYWGVESSAGGVLVGGSTAYDVAIRFRSGTGLSLGDSSAKYARLSSTGLAVTGTLSATAPIKAGGYTVGTLPAGAVGQIAYVTDQLTTVNAKGIAPTGGGAVVAYQYHNGSAWVGI